MELRYWRNSTYWNIFLGVRVWIN